MFPISFALLNAQQKHDYILNNFVLHKSAESQRHKRDIDVIKENHRFLWEDNDIPQTWETRLAKKYYDKLLKEYCIADLCRYKENKIAMRWRTEVEVVSGKGQFQCGSRKCEIKEELRSWEVNFGYMEQGEKKNALVKLRLCPEHTMQLNYTSKKREVKRQKRTAFRKAKEGKSKTKRSKDKSSKKTHCDSTSGDDEKKDHGNGHERNQSNSECYSELKRTDECRGDDDESATTREDNVWAKKPEIESETKTRETDFEKYLEDLLL